MPSWKQLHDDAPDYASLVASAFAANLHHVVGTLRPDGAPRLSGTEVRIDDDHVRVGMMAGSLKLRDVERDPRIELHTAPLDVELTGTGDAKISGQVRYEAPADEAEGSMFVVDIAAVSHVRVEGDELVLSVWTPARGLHVTRRR